MAEIFDLSNEEILTPDLPAAQAGTSPRGTSAGICRFLEGAIRNTSRCLALPGGIAVIALLLLVCSNAGSRIFGISIRGAVECSGILGALTASLALSSAQVHGNHITGGIASARLPGRLRLIPEIFSLLTGCFFFLLCAYEVADIGIFALESGEVVDGLGSLYPLFILLTVPGFLGQAIVLGCRLIICLLTGKE